MATRKEKHARAMAKREKFLAEERARGLEFQKKGHEEIAKRRQAKERKAREEADLQNKKLEDLATLVAMLTVHMGRVPTDQEVIDFIYDDEYRVTIMEGTA